MNERKALSLGFGHGERSPWNDFPHVIRNGSLGSIKDDPAYLKAKSGDATAALDLVIRNLSDESVAKVKELIGSRKPSILPVLGIEGAGKNKIPAAVAAVLADRIGLEVEADIVQIDKISRTGSGADHRLAFNPSFSGKVMPGREYLIVDDNLTMGGTIASLRGYVQNRGGEVIGAVVMAARENSLSIAVTPKMLAAIRAKHGHEMNEFWEKNFGYGIDRLTQAEAGHLRRAASIESIRDRIIAARHAGIHRMDAAGTATDERREGAPGVEANDASREAEAQRLVESAVSEKREQQAMVEASPLESTWQESLASYVQLKHDQVARLEDRLEKLLANRQRDLKQNSDRKPGVFALPKTRRTWQDAQFQKKARIQSLVNRLGVVREIRSGMGMFAPRIEELATRKMRAAHPEMASDWDAMREAFRTSQIKGRIQTKAARKELSATKVNVQRVKLSIEKMK